MGKKAKLSFDDLEQMLVELNTEMEKLYQQIKNVSTNLNTLMKGDSNGPYWNGAVAKSFYNGAVKNLNENLYGAYKEASEFYDELYKRRNKLIRQTMDNKSVF